MKFLSSQLTEITNLFKCRLRSISIAFTSTYKICSDARLNFVLTHNSARHLRFAIRVWYESVRFMETSTCQCRQLKLNPLST